MAKVLYKWRVNCTTHGHVYIWNETEPDKCPINTSDTIDLNKTSIVEKYDPNVFSIQEEQVPTGGNFSIESRIISADANTTEHHDHLWPFPINVLQVSFISKSEHVGDELELVIGPETPVTALVQNSASGDSKLYVSDTTYLMAGYFLHINGDDLGWIQSVDKVEKSVTLATATSNSYIAGDVVKRSVKPIKNYYIGYPWKYDIGSSKIGGSYVPANTTIRVSYKNNSANPKIIYSEIEFLY